jgi:hypothetical protein
MSNQHYARTTGTIIIFIIYARVYIHTCIYIQPIINYI